MSNLSREELIDRVAEIELWPELKPDLNGYLSHYVQSKDPKLVELLLNAGADPDSKEELDCYLHHLFHEYKATKSTSGDAVLQIMEMLLKAGANPNRVWCNNWRAYDYAVEENIIPIASLLEKYNVDKKPREYI